MGYHDERDLPNYWAYASNFVLQDHMFEPNASWSLPAHLFLVSGWSASCTTAEPSSCTNALQVPVVIVPADTTSIGNVIVQAVALGHIQSLAWAREMVRNSFKTETIVPHAADWEAPYERLAELVSA